MLDFKQLKIDSEGLSILHVEDNEPLRENALKLLKKFFDTVYTASDGKKGLEIFKKYNPNIVITDIKMPYITGLELAQNIKNISPQTKVIIMSAFDDKEYLYQAIELGIFRYLKKPVNLSELLEILDSAVLQIRHEENLRLLDIHIKNIFNYQSSMVVMLKEYQLFLANQVFLDFFDVKDILHFTRRYGNLGSQFLEHDGFLYNRGDTSCLDTLSANSQKLYHVKLKDRDDAIRHFLLKYQAVPQKSGLGILSFDDITELNLLRLFDEKQSKKDENLQDIQALIKFLEVLQRNGVKVHLHNYYKGLSITNDAIITDIFNSNVVLKTNYLQQKAIQFEQKSLLVSDTLPNVIACETTVNISFEKQVVEFKNLHFVANSPVKRKTIRVVPEEKYTVSLFLGENKCQGNIKIVDISIDTIKLELNVLPAGLSESSDVILDIVLTTDKQHLIINTKATMFRKEENKFNFSIVFIFKFTPQQKSDMVKYITKRQMSIIREFKGLQNG
ncbi:MAG: response regulator [Sulfurimonas sp.]|jgi:CheY-like chemotaxis protein